MNLKNKVLENKGKKSIIYDLSFVENTKEVVIFCHGYKGFKDWGAWNLVAKEFENSGLSFCKFNFSHNGGTLENPIDFSDLESFGNNTYSLELEDLERMITFLKEEYSFDKIHVIGHSRGGGTVLIKASENKTITSVITWASVSDYANRFPKKDALLEWKNKGVYYVKNGRTKQEMPHYYGFYIDFKENEKRLNIENATSNLKIPHLIIHGIQDQSVDFSQAEDLTIWSPYARLYSLDSNHVFGAKHPWEKDTLPEELKEITLKTIDFIQTL